MTGLCYQNLHFFGCIDSQQFERGHELKFHQPAELKKKYLFCRVLFGEHAVAVVEEIKRLRQLERVFRDERRLLRGYGRIDLHPEGPREQNHFPE